MKLLTVTLLGSILFITNCSKTKPKAETEVPTTPTVVKPIEESTSSAPVTHEEITKVQDLINQILGNTVFFDFDKSQITEEGKNLLAEVGGIMINSEVGKKINVNIGGHTDVVGTEDYNLALGEKRAEAVRDYLESYGVKAGRVTITSYGEETPVEEGETHQAHAANRRAEFKAVARIP